MRSSDRDVGPPHNGRQPQSPLARAAETAWLIGVPLLVALVAAILAGGALAGPVEPGADEQAVDASVRPGDDFYQYGNGVWLTATRIPEGRSRYDTTAMLRDRAAAQVRTIVETAARQNAAGRPSRIGAYYAAWMDLGAIEARGLKPLSEDLAAIAALRDSHGLSAYLGRTLRLDDGTNTTTDGLFGVWVHQGFHGPRYVPHLVQGGLGLPTREAYLNATPEAQAARAAYRDHIAAVLALAGFDQAADRAERVLALETAIARTHASRADTDDVQKTDNPWRRADFEAKAPGMDWTAFFRAAGLDRQDEVIVWQPSAVIGAAALVHDQPMRAWRDYLAFHLIEHGAGALPAAFGAADTAFQARLTGVAASPAERSELALTATSAALGEDIGRLYVARYFPPSAKAAATEMAENIRTAMAARVARQDWRSAGARRMALAKVRTLEVATGYPDHWIDYSGLVVKPSDAWGNLRRAEAFAYARALTRLGRPADPGEWIQLYPQQVGAIINFSPNALLFSAALLQPPFFDPTGDAASNYGSAGAGMAHEFTHSIDELGNLYDDQGRLEPWWTAADVERYHAVWAPLKAQYDAYCPRPGQCLDGQLVQGESIADLAGLLVAHDAYLLSLHGRPDRVIGGLTGDQRFYLAFARRWRRLQTDAALARQIAADTHAPGPYRTAIVRNTDDWVRAFGVKPGDRLYLPPEQRLSW